jgi:hypothetical protein
MEALTVGKAIFLWASFVQEMWVKSIQERNEKHRQRNASRIFAALPGRRKSLSVRNDCRDNLLPLLGA